ncbi:MAG TPA: hypothetical protein VFJ06_01905 [Halococcus sp.]|nr:hypothetical protein [Halococcus sp.]
MLGTISSMVILLLSTLNRKLIFIGFFVVALLALALHRYRYVRESAVVLFLVALLLVNVVGVFALPLTHLHLYSNRAPNVDIEYELWIVDADGNELQYDRRAAEPMGDGFQSITYRMATKYSQKRNEEIAAFLLENAREYRNHVESDHLVPIEFPRAKTHILDYRWRKEDLSGYSKFVGIRIYRVTTGYAANGSHIVSQDETIMVTIYPGRNTTSASSQLEGS